MLEKQFHTDNATVVPVVLESLCSQVEGKNDSAKRMVGIEWLQWGNAYVVHAKEGTAFDRINLPNPLVINGKGNFIGRQGKSPTSFISTHLYLKSLDCISISQQLILSRIPMTGPIIDSGGAAATLKTDKQYQYSCLLSFTCLSLSPDPAENSRRGHFISLTAVDRSAANSCAGESCFILLRTFSSCYLFQKSVKVQSSANTIHLLSSFQ